MKINIFSIGHNKNQDILNLEKEYLKRLTRFCKIKLKEFNDEKKLLTEFKNNNYFIIGLEEAGEKFATLKFSEFIDKKMQSGHILCFIIADEAGFNKNVEEKFNLTLSLSALTFPHEISRMLLCEQLYRAFTVLNNHPYHK